MKDIEHVNCKKCGFSNVKGAKRCIKCNTKLEAVTRSCPKCAKRNSLDAKVCVSCGYKFDKGHRTIWANLIISGSLVLVLCVLVYLEHEGLVNNITKLFKLFAALGIIVLLYSTLNYGSKDKVDYNLEDDIIEDNKRFSVLKRISNIAIIIGGIVILGILVFNYFVK